MNEGWLEEVPLDECLRHLREEPVGRISVVIDACPVVLPVNYRFVETSGRTWVAFRTRAGNVIDHGGINAAFEIDHIDPSHRQGWSVLVRGTLHHVDADAADFRERFGPDLWLGDERNAWMAIDPFAITGRQLHAAEPDWAFAPHAYL